VKPFATQRDGEVDEVVRALDPAAVSGGGLEDLEVDAPLGEEVGCCHPGGAGTNDDHSLTGPRRAAVGAVHVRGDVAACGCKSSDTEDAGDSEKVSPGDGHREPATSPPSMPAVLQSGDGSIREVWHRSAFGSRAA